MTLREEIQERIAKIDDAALPDLLDQLDRFEKRRRGFSQEFFDTLDRVHERNKDLSGEEAMEMADEAVRWARQNRER